jgi:hypothetical protein
MTQTCLPTEAYYHINRNTPRMTPRFKVPEDPEIKELLLDLETWVARTQDWEAAFRLTFGDKAFEEDYPAIDWSADRFHWGADARHFADAFVLADRFVATVMHRLYPFQQKEMIPALTHALVSQSERRCASLPSTLEEDQAISLLNWANYDNIAEWLEEQR